MNFFKKDNLRFGLLLGFLAPLLGVVIMYYWKFHNSIGWKEFLHILPVEKRLLASLTVICLFINVALFTFYVNTHRDQTAKGIFAITLVYAIISLLVKFLA